MFGQPRESTSVTSEPHLAAQSLESQAMHNKRAGIISAAALAAAALVPTPSQAAGLDDADLNPETQVHLSNFSGPGLRGVSTSADGKQATVYAGPNQEVTAIASCPSESNGTYTMEVEILRGGKGSFYITEQTENPRTGNDGNRQINAVADNKEGATTAAILRCIAGNAAAGDDSEMELVVVATNATGTINGMTPIQGRQPMPAGTGSSWFTKNTNWGVGLGVPFEHVSNPNGNDPDIAVGVGVYGRAQYNFNQNIGLGLRLDATWQPVDYQDLDDGTHGNGDVDVENVFMGTGLVEVPVQLGPVRLAPGVGAAWIPAAGTNGVTELENESSAVVAMGATYMIGNTAKPRLELGLHGQMDPASFGGDGKDSTQNLMVTLGLTN